MNGLLVFVQRIGRVGKKTLDRPLSSLPFKASLSCHHAIYQVSILKGGVGPRVSTSPNFSLELRGRIRIESL